MSENPHRNLRIRHMREEIHQLANQQVTVMTAAALRGMTSDEAEAYESRHERIRYLLKELQFLKKGNGRRRRAISSSR